jgi:hypothetical protein
MTTISLIRNRPNRGQHPLQLRSLLLEERLCLPMMMTTMIPFLVVANPRPLLLWLNLLLQHPL